MPDRWLTAEETEQARQLALQCTAIASDGLDFAMVMTVIVMLFVATVESFDGDIEDSLGEFVENSRRCASAHRLSRVDSKEHA